MGLMKVAMYYNNNDVRIQDMEIPSINDDEVLVKVHSSGICGSDVMEWYRIKKAPLVLGHEIGGEIVKVGRNVKEYKIGDRVFVSHHVPCNECNYCLDDKHTLCDTLHSTNYYPGGFAEYIRIPKINVEIGVFKLPDEITYDQSVFIEPLACVVRSIRISEMKPDKNVLIIGSGIAGLLHVKLARFMGANKIISTDINDYRLKIAKKIGSDFLINAKKDLISELNKINGGVLPDYVFLCTGATSAVTQALLSVNQGGTIMFFAPTKPGIEIPFPLFDLWNKEVKMVSTYAGAPKDIEESIDLIKDKKITIEDLISHKLPLEEASKGFKLVEKAEESIKVILKPHK
jgi:L-iditol 2-dehydrogenase